MVVWCSTGFSFCFFYFGLLLDIINKAVRRGVKVNLEREENIFKVSCFDFNFLSFKNVIDAYNIC